MAGGLADLDTGMPERKGSTEKQLQSVYDYLVLLLENLRYILRNLGPENMNEAEVLPWLNDKLEVKTLISNTVITNELYAEYGAIADLVVDELRTDYRKAYFYLNGITSNIDYLRIQDEEIEYVTGTVRRVDGVPQTEQLHYVFRDPQHPGDPADPEHYPTQYKTRYFWWMDNTYTQMTSLENTGLPVMVYQYDELVKGTYHFETITQNGTTVKVPVLVFGAGTGDQQDPDIGKGFVRKDTDSLDVYLHGTADNGIFIGQYTDLVGLRKPTAIDFSSWGDGTQDGAFSETLDGSIVNAFTVKFDANQRPVKFIDGEGHETAVTW